LATKHDQNRAEKRERLVRAAVDAFTETGFENTTVSDVVRRAGMTPSTFYNYYRDKDALRDELLDRTVRQMVAALGPIRSRARTLDEYVRLVCRGLFAAMVLDRGNAMLLKRNLPLLRSLIDSEVMRPLYTTLREDIERATRNGSLQPVDLDYATAVLRAAAFEIGVVLLSQPTPDVGGAIEFAAGMLGLGLDRGGAGHSRDR